ncbi:hypothetical protein LSH36_257g01006 [Paralvinella palmiformis]|uniref:Sm domain-containing protein n=1 Tax=Paralvinella palmiformis TaxID=53620 RepID=A0AAD9JKQ8_9ANNE|nr:hypothetical protein LSH36_257g01006 [Paralvinella palmiformis]
MSLVERAKSLNSLACFLQGLEGKVTTVELRNECSCIGRIDSVDSSMNTHLSDVTLITPFGNKHKFESFYVKGKNIRYVHVPDDVNVIRTILSQIGVHNKVHSHTERKEKRLNKWQKKLHEERKERRRVAELQHLEKERSGINEASDVKH